ncbi:hypothetical protein SAMN05216251_11840 [Actinacidiphila alni]|uniref:Uncharacterized protein n=2 Tax=Actinacidiphila alni TaxID=380248 RepID=A0A1I2JK12_9ACTN|nr:hypothetical protein SAMN05216251_11840 [Actinacidiphila alni]
MCHQAHFSGKMTCVTHGRNPVEESAVFSGSIDWTPYAENPDERIPVANVWIIDDYWIRGLSPTGLAEFAAQLRSQADYFDQEVRPRLVEARAEWGAWHASRTADGGAS